MNFPIGFWGITLLVAPPTLIRTHPTASRAGWGLRLFLLQILQEGTLTKVTAGLAWRRSDSIFLRVLCMTGLMDGVHTQLAAEPSSQ